MVAKLKSVLQNPISQSAFRAVIFGLFLNWSPFFLVPAAIWLYFRPIWNSFAFIWSFILLLFLSLWTISTVTTFVFSWLVIIFFSFLFFVILGLKNFVFIERKKWYFFLSFSLFYAAFLNFFLVDKSSLFFFKWFILLVVVFLLFRELLEKRNLVSLVLALIIGEFLWVISWLPIGFLNSANLMILLVLLFADLTINHFWHRLGKRLIIKDLLFFFALLALIFLTSSWRL